MFENKSTSRLKLLKDHLSFADAFCRFQSSSSEIFTFSYAEAQAAAFSLRRGSTFFGPWLVLKKTEIRVLGVTPKWMVYFMENP